MVKQKEQLDGLDGLRNWVALAKKDLGTESEEVLNH